MSEISNRSLNPSSQEKGKVQKTQWLDDETPASIEINKLIQSEESESDSSDYSRENNTPREEASIRKKIDLEWETDLVILRTIRKLIILILHSLECENQTFRPNGDLWHCFPSQCKIMKKVLKHMPTCEAEKSCSLLYCDEITKILFHCKNCVRANCRVCFPFKHTKRNMIKNLFTANMYLPLEQPNVVLLDLKRACDSLVSQCLGNDSDLDSVKRINKRIENRVFLKFTSQYQSSHDSGVDSDSVSLNRIEGGINLNEDIGKVMNGIEPGANSNGDVTINSVNGIKSGGHLDSVTNPFSDIESEEDSNDFINPIDKNQSAMDLTKFMDRNQSIMDLNNDKNQSETDSSLSTDLNQDSTFLLDLNQDSTFSINLNQSEMESVMDLNLNLNQLDTDSTNLVDRIESSIDSNGIGTNPMKVLDLRKKSVDSVDMQIEKQPLFIAPNKKDEELFVTDIRSNQQQFIAPVGKKLEKSQIAISSGRESQLELINSVKKQQGHPEFQALGENQFNQLAVQRTFPTSAEWDLIFQKINEEQLIQLTHAEQCLRLENSTNVEQCSIPYCKVMKNVLITTSNVSIMQIAINLSIQILNLLMRQASLSQNSGSDVTQSSSEK